MASMKLLARTLSDKAHAAVEHEVINALSITRVSRGHGAHPNVTHYPGIGIHGGNQLPWPGYIRAQKLTQSRVGPRARCAIVVVANDTGPEVLIAKAQGGAALARTVIAPRIAGQSSGGQTIKKLDLWVLNAWRDRQLPAVCAGIQH